MERGEQSVAGQSEAFAGRLNVILATLPALLNKENRGAFRPFSNQDFIKTKHGFNHQANNSRRRFLE